MLFVLVSLILLPYYLLFNWILILILFIIIFCIHLLITLIALFILLSIPHTPSHKISLCTIFFPFRHFILFISFS